MTPSSHITRPLGPLSGQSVRIWIKHPLYGNPVRLTIPVGSVLQYRHLSGSETTPHWDSTIVTWTLHGSVLVQATDTSSGRGLLEHSSNSITEYCHVSDRYAGARVPGEPALRYPAWQIN